MTTGTALLDTDTLSEIIKGRDSTYPAADARDLALKGGGTSLVNGGLSRRLGARRAWRRRRRRSCSHGSGPPGRRPAPARGRRRRRPASAGSSAAGGSW